MFDGGDLCVEECVFLGRSRRIVEGAGGHGNQAGGARGEERYGRKAAGNTEHCVGEVGWRSARREGGG